MWHTYTKLSFSYSGFICIICSQWRKIYFPSASSHLWPHLTALQVLFAYLPLYNTFRCISDPVPANNITLSMCWSASYPHIQISSQSNRAVNHVINILNSSSSNFVFDSDIIDSLCFNAQNCLWATFLQMFVFPRLILTTNDIKALFLMTHFAMDCPVRAFARAADLSINDGPVG